MTLTRKKQRNTTNSEMITGIRKEPTETHIQAFRKHSEDAEDQEASIVISSDDELATTAEVGERAGDTTKQFICKDCGECFMYHASFNFCGKCLKVRKNLKRYHCKECGQSFGRKDHLKRHSYSHSGSSFICSDCGIRFRDPGELRTHEKTHRVRNHVCQLCEKRFEQQEELMLHSEVAHPGPDGYTCHHCGKTFSKVKNLGKHRMIHSYKTPHVCSHCGKRFKRQEHLRRHESLHTNEKHHLCHCCGDAFVRKEDLNTHLSKKHTTLVC
uniref:C2H2-type domain-containing protein n=1 Tax=Esox lucius TaxID=8010 RepID=A0AAY5KIY5_ESOLU